MAPPDTKLDAQAFPPFGELLEACQDYAILSGCRFQSYAFDGSDVSGKMANLEEWKAAVQKAMPKVNEFRKRVQAQEPLLMESIDLAFRLISAEGVRSGIVATCQEMGLWPPNDVSISDDDCAFQDTTAPLPLIAQRAYNDEMRREREESLQMVYRKATTASFLVDFVTEAGLTLPSLTESYREMLDEFMKRVEEWSQGASSRFDLCPLARAGKALNAGLAKGGLAAEAAKDRVQQRWSQNWDTRAGTAVNVVATALAVTATVVAMRRASRAKS